MNRLRLSLVLITTLVGLTKAQAQVSVSTVLPREREIELAQQQLKIAQTQVSVGRATSEETLKAEREVLRLQRELAALPASPSGSAPPSTVTREEAEELIRVRALIQRSPDLINASTASSRRRACGFVTTTTSSVAAELAGTNWPQPSSPSDKTRWICCWPMWLRAR